MVQDPSLPTDKQEVANPPVAPTETPAPTPAGDGKEKSPKRRGSTRTNDTVPPASSDTASSSEDATEDSADDIVPPASSDTASASEDDTEVNINDTSAPQSAESSSEFIAHSALEEVARRIILDQELDIVFMTTDGTAFFGYSDASNYARNLADQTVRYFASQRLSTSDLSRLLPPHLQPSNSNE